MINNKDLYKCYSINLYYFLKANGFRYLFKEFNNKTNKYCWVFEKTGELQNALRYWSSQKQTENKEVE